MKSVIKRRRLIDSVMSLFGTTKTVNAHKLYPEKYFRNIYFTKPLFDGIEFLAKVERKSKKQMAHELMEMGIGHYLGDKISEQNRKTIAAREKGLAATPSYFILMLRQWAKSKGKDISKFV